MPILVLADHDNQTIRGATLNTVSAAAQCGGDVHVLVAGHNAGEAAKAAAQIAGVAKVLHADGEHLAHGLAENVAEQVLALASGYSHILFPATPSGKNIAPRVAAKLDVGQLSDVSRIDIYKADAAVKALLPDNKHLHNWIDMAQQRIRFQGLPARICWLGLGDRHRVGLALNDMVASGEISAPIVIGRDHLDSGSVASPNRETEAMKDGSDAVSDWALLNALLSTAGGATWVSLHHGGGVGMGYSQHAGMVILADGTEAAARKLARVLWNDPASGVMRHADAGYDIAIDCAHEMGLDLPMIGNA